MRRTLIALALAGAIFAGCGDDEDTETAATATPSAAVEDAENAAEDAVDEAEEAVDEAAETAEGAVAVTSPESGALEFDPDSLTAKAGTVTIAYANPSSTPHAFAIDGVDGAETETVSQGAAPPIQVELEAGEYEFYCPVGGHRAAGMVGTLTVE
ncbi:MAG TPA: cupredoxin domain-containing protein [Solirubrobacteraceae bacterium]|nr:cupredoxin domain-containing protein [Solirubrobacteraceae bacterium]